MFIAAHEFIIVGYFKRTEGYHFGEEGPVPWYYKTVGLYANYCLITGLVSITAIGLILFGMIKKTNTILLSGFVVTFLLIAISILS